MAFNYTYSSLAYRIHDVVNQGRQHPHYAFAFRRFIVAVVLIDMVGVFLRTYSLDNRSFEFVLYAIGVTSAFIYFLEYLCRVWTAPIEANDRLAVRSRLRYMVSALGIVDLLAVMPYLISKFLPDHSLVNLVMEFTKLFLIFKLVRFSPSFALITNAFASVRKELMAGFSIAAATVVFAALAMYYVEKEAQPEVFDNVGQGFWWAIVTFTTVGYGDIYPITLVGKLLASAVGIVGITMIALPTGILSSAFMAQLSKRRQEEECGEETKYSYKYCPHCGKKLEKKGKENDVFGEETA